MKTILCALLLTHLALANGQLKSLNDASSKSVEALLTPNSLAVLFQPGCHACRKQIRDLNCLEEEHTILLLGIGGTEIALRNEYARMGVSYKAYELSPKHFQSMGFGADVTPQVLSFSKGIKRLLMGYQPCQTLKRRLTSKI